MPFLLALLAVLAALLAVIMARALLFVPPKLEAVPSEDIQADEGRLTRNLQAMLRLKTVSHAEEGLADEAQFAAFRELLSTLYPAAFARCAVELHGKGGLLLHLKGQDSRAPSVLMAHYDVVPAEEVRWAHPPFEGLLIDGEVWGRGALDTKCTVLCLMEALEAQLMQGFVPKNDLYISLGGDEETLGKDASAIVDALEARGVRPAFVLDEGGAVVSGVFPGVPGSAALVGIAEKGSAFIDITAKGRAGHASAPPARQAAGALSRALLRVTGRPMPFNMTEPARALFDTLGRHSTFFYKLIFANLWYFAPLLDLICRKAGGELNALVRTTTAITRLSAAQAYNVLPSEVKAGVNLRLISGDSVEAARERLEKIIASPEVSVELVRGSEPSIISPPSGEAWRRLERAIRQTYKEAVVSPYLMVAASDSRHFCRISNHVYRFSGFPLARAQLSLIHSQDERIPARLLPDAFRFYTRVIRQC